MASGAEGLAEDAPLEPRELFRSTDLLVRAVMRPGAALCYVTFDSYADHPGLDRQGFGEDHFQRYGISAVHVISRDNHWYQHPELPEALAVIARAVEGCDTVVAYGSSMGGFAALRYGSAAGATTAIAISPQYTLEPGAPPFDTRWHADVVNIRFQDFAPPPLPAQVILYDPRDRLDRAHVELFAARSATVLVSIPFAGHPVGSYVNEVGMFDRLFDGVATGTLTPATAPDFERELRDRRRMSGQYYFNLAVRLWPRRLSWALPLIERAIAARPDSAAYLSYGGFLFDKAGRHDEAAALHGSAMAIPAVSIHSRIHHVLHFAERGDAAEARRQLVTLQADFPGNRLVRICAKTVRQRRTTIALMRGIGRVGMAGLVDRLSGGRWKRLLVRYAGYQLKRR